jgi:serine/threonine-protein kinase BUR1
VVALKKILMHHEKEGVSPLAFLVCLSLTDNRYQFPITAIREIKLMKALSHPNILQLREMAIERGKGQLEKPLC